VIGNLAVGIQDFVIPAPQGDFESIATVVVGSGGASSIDFTSIPGTFQHLQIRGIGRNSDAASNDIQGLVLQYNADTGNNYSWHVLQGTGSAASSSAATSTDVLYSGYTPTNGSTSNTFGAFIIDILDYKDTNKYTTQRVLTGVETNNSANSRVGLWSASWRNTNAITSIKIYNTNGNFTQHSYFALYGIKG
jgi:hypothetical protein